MVVISKPKPVKVNRKESPYCKCKYINANKEDYKVCAKCKKPIKEKNWTKVLIRLLDNVLRDIVLLRDGFCVCPSPIHGHGKKRQAGHLITRAKKSVKYDLYNVNEQCDSCNGLHENYPERYNNWFANKFGIEKYNEICREGDKTVDLSVVDYEQLYYQLRSIYECQQADRNFKPRFTQKEIMSGEWKLKIGGLISGVQNEQDIFQRSVGVEQGFFAERQAISKVV